MTETDPTVLQAISVDFQYSNAEQSTALAGIDLSVGPGEWIAVMGENGSGKSTLLKILAGILRPTGGRVLMNGADLQALPSRSEVARRIGIVFQDPETQMVSPTVERELAFGMEQIALRPDHMRHKVNELSQAFDLESVRRRPPQSLSGGEKQRVSVASILAMGPSVLLLDEPTALLDAGARDTLMAMLERIRSVGSVSVVLVTAFPEEALRADRVVVLFKGRRVAEEEPRSLFLHAQDCERWGLARPPATLLTAELRDRGVEFPPNVMTADEFVSEWVGGDHGRRKGGPS